MVQLCRLRHRDCLQSRRHLRFVDITCPLPYICDWINVIWYYSNVIWYYSKEYFRDEKEMR